MDFRDIKFVPRGTTVEEFIKDPKYDGFCIGGYTRNSDDGTHTQKVFKKMGDNIFDYRYPLPNLDFDGDFIIPEVNEVD